MKPIPLWVVLLVRWILSVAARQALNRIFQAIYSLTLLFGFLFAFLGIALMFLQGTAQKADIISLRLIGTALTFNGLYFGLWAWGQLFKSET